MNTSLIRKDSSLAKGWTGTKLHQWTCGPPSETGHLLTLVPFPKTSTKLCSMCPVQVVCFRIKSEIFCQESKDTKIQDEQKHCVTYFDTTLI